MPDESSVSQPAPPPPAPPPAPVDTGVAQPAIDRAADKRYSPRKKLDQLLSTRGFGVVMTLFFVVPTVVLSVFGFAVLEGQQRNIAAVLSQNFEWVATRTADTIERSLLDEFSDIDQQTRAIVERFVGEPGDAGPALRTIPETLRFSYITAVYVYDGAGRLVYPLAPERSAEALPPVLELPASLEAARGALLRGEPGARGAMLELIAQEGNRWPASARQMARLALARPETGATTPDEQLAELAAAVNVPPDDVASRRLAREIRLKRMRLYNTLGRHGEGLADLQWILAGHASGERLIPPDLLVQLLADADALVANPERIMPLSISSEERRRRDTAIAQVRNTVTRIRAVLQDKESFERAFTGRFAQMASEGREKQAGLSEAAAPDSGELRLARHVPCELPSRRLVVFVISPERLLTRTAAAMGPSSGGAESHAVTLLDHRDRPVPRPVDPSLEIQTEHPLDGVGLPRWRVAVYHRGLRTVAGLTSAFATQLYFWLIFVFLLVAGVGMVAMFRYVARELQTVGLKSDFVSNVTHELKTPLTSIRMFIETLQLGRVKDEAERRECLDIIASESERLSRLIDRVLDFSKMEHGNKVFTFEMNDVEKVVRTTIDLFRSQMAEGGGVIRLFIAKAIPKVRCDRDAVREILLNLLSNAIKYSIGNRLVIVRVYATKKHAVIEVTDNGIGIPKSDLKKIFEKFYRVDEKLTRQVEGSGLGLTISQFIAEAHGGEIKVESERGRGSKFSLFLPLSGAKAEGEEPA